jgi:multidomain signaling protein FimX
MSNAVQEQKLAELISRYVKGLPERLHEISQAWERLKHVEWHDKHIDIMLHGAHKLAGSGTTFQFPDISTCAAQLESALLATRQPGGAGPRQQQLISASLASLAGAIRHATAMHQGKTPALPASPPSTRTTVNISLVEDDADQAALLSEWLLHAGYQVRHFTSPAEYQDRDSAEMELILLDIHFSGYEIDGLTWLEQVREKIPAHCPVIIMSTRTDLVARMRALRAGASGFISKPIPLDELAAILERALRQTVPRREKILCIDDDQEILNFYREILGSAGYQVDVLAQPLKTLHRLEHFRPDLVILDHSMPGCSGADLIAMLRQDPQFLTLPIIFSSAHTPESLRRQPQLLVNDWLQKPVNAESLLPAVRRQLSRAAQVSSQIRKISQRPAASQLMHEGAFLAELERLISQPGQTKQQLVHVTVDQHDYLLAREGRQQVSRQTRDIENFLCQRPEIAGHGCVVGPLSFLLLANSENELFAESLHGMLAIKKWLLSDNTLTFSIGSTPFVSGSHLGDTLRRAEQACTEAMKQGGNRVKVESVTATTEKPGEDDQGAIALIREKRFKLMFQPIINLETGETLFETFVRLEGQDGHNFTPVNFAGLIASNLSGGAYSLDRWLLDQALLQLGAVGGKEAENYSVVVRLFSSVSQIEKLVPMISNALSSSRIRGTRRVIFAVPEAHLVREPERARGVFEKLAGLKCGIMLTDVGETDFSHHVIRDAGSVDFIKLALRYGKSQEGAELIAPLLEDIRQHFDGKVALIAAGVEDMSVMTTFWDKGIRYFQGYFIQRPADVMQYNPNA